MEKKVKINVILGILCGFLFVVCVGWLPLNHQVGASAQYSRSTQNGQTVTETEMWGYDSSILYELTGFGYVCFWHSYTYLYPNGTIVERPYHYGAQLEFGHVGEG